jgi:hypothetical protein
LALDVPDAEAVFAQAVAAGAEVRQPLQEVFWATCTASSRIRSGIAGMSASTCATCRTTRSSLLRRGRSLEMRSRLLGWSGLQVSELCLGATVLAAVQRGPGAACDP